MVCWQRRTPAMHPTYVCSNDELTSTVTNGFAAAGGEGDFTVGCSTPPKMSGFPCPKTCLILDINLHLDSGSLSCWLRCDAVVFPSSFHAKCGIEVRSNADNGCCPAQRRVLVSLLGSSSKTCNLLRHNRNASTVLQLSDFHDFHDTSKTSDAPRQHAPRISRSHAVAQYLLAPTSVQR
jgi:hypothetical protein